MANITHKWKKWMGLGCTHARYIDPTAWEAAMTFRERFKPHIVAHLGDAIDLTGLMAHGKGTDSQGDDITPDIDTGLQHLRELRPDVFVMGNHEARAYELTNSKVASTAYSAFKIIQEIEKTCQKIKCRAIPYDGVYQQVFSIADMAMIHGVQFNQTAARDTAKDICTNGVWRKVIFVHTHQVAIQSTTGLLPATGYNIGTLTARGALKYANRRPATRSWTQAWAWGYYNEELMQSVVYITSRLPEEVWVQPF